MAAENEEREREKRREGNGAYPFSNAIIRYGPLVTIAAYPVLIS